MISKFIYGLVIFSSAFLLFQVQPLLGKVILPWFGGSAGVWIVCLLFFQVVLLLGYWYAHVLVQKFGARTQDRIHAGLLAVSLLLLPIVPKESWKPVSSSFPALHILWILTLTVGLPYFLLTSTSPILQAWYAREGGSFAVSFLRRFQRRLDVGARELSPSRGAVGCDFAARERMVVGVCVRGRGRCDCCAHFLSWGKVYRGPQYKGSASSRMESPGFMG